MLSSRVNFFTDGQVRVRWERSGAADWGRTLDAAEVEALR
jgi:hypothetical protein